MNIRRQFRVVTVNDDGSETRWPMKAWLREKEHQEFVPEGVDVSTTGDSSPQIARRLLADGWSSQEKEDQFLLFPPYGNRPLPVDEDSDDIEPDDEYGFGMERELRDFLAHNLNLVKIGEGSLRLYSDQTQSGIEYKTEVGRIDILAVDDVGAFYVFELTRIMHQL